MIFLDIRGPTRFTRFGWTLASRSKVQPKQSHLCPVGEIDHARGPIAKDSNRQADFGSAHHGEVGIVLSLGSLLVDGRSNLLTEPAQRLGCQVACSS